MICSFNRAYSQNRIFIKGSDLYETSIGDDIKKIKMPWGRLGSSIVVVYKNGTKSYFRKKAIWGFENDDKKILRFKDGNIYEVVDTSIVIIYNTYSRSPVYYFSRSLDSDVLLLTRKKMIKTLEIDTFAYLYKKSPFMRRLIN
jgi:hypothetical protein